MVNQCTRCLRPHAETQACAWPPWLSDDRIASRFEVIRCLGRGGMGEMYLVRTTSGPSFQRALKSIRADRTGSDFIARFEEEASTAMRVRHPNIAQLFDYFVCADGTPVAVWEYIDGHSLAEQLSRSRLEVRESLRVIAELLDGLTAIHDQRMVHRDIKPGNVMMEKATGRIRIIDFGLCKPRDAADDSRHAVGTFNYMPPEAWEVAPARLEPPADIFAAGAVFYELLTRKKAFAGDNAIQIATRIAREEPAWVGILDPDRPTAKPLIAILRRAMAKDARDRYQTAREFRDDIVELQRQLDRPDGPVPLPRAESFADEPTERVSPANKRIPAEIAEILGRVEDIETDHVAFFGRSEQIAHAEAFARSPAKPIGAIVAPAGTGKSAFMAELVRRLRIDGELIVLRHHFSSRYSATSGAAEAYRSLLSQLAMANGEPIPERLSEDDARARLYDALRNQRQKRVVLVIDAIDEAGDRFELPIPMIAPYETVAVVSVRGDADNFVLPPSMQALRSKIALLPFARTLAADEVRGWIRTVLGESVSDELLFRIVSQTGGFALYLHHLLGDISAAVAAGERAEQALTRTPADFVAYVRQSVMASGREPLWPRVSRILAALAVARRAITMRQLARVLQHPVNEVDFAALPAQLRGWISCHRRGGESDYSISHPLLAAEVAVQLGTVATDMEQALTDDCGRWREHRDEYALHCYDAHLLRAGRFDLLAGLIRDEEYAAAQAAASDGSALRRRFLFNVMSEAARRSEIGVVAQCVVAYGAGFREPPAVSRIVADAIDRGMPEVIARAAAESAGVPLLQSVLSLVALREADRHGDALLVERLLRSLSLPSELYFRLLAARIFATLEHAELDTIVDVSRKYLNEPSWRKLIELRGEHFPGDALPLFRSLAEDVTDPATRSKILVGVIVNTARVSPLMAEELLSSHADVHTRAWALRRLCGIAVGESNETRALAYVQQLHHLTDEADSDDLRWPLAEAYCDVMRMIAATDRPRAAFILRRMSRLMNMTISNTAAACAVGAYAQAHFHAGRVDVAGKLLERSWTYAIDMAKRRLLTWRARRTLLYLSKVAMVCGKTDVGVSLAREAVGFIESGLGGKYAVDTICRAALLLFSAGSEAAAFELVREIPNAGVRALGRSSLAEQLVLTGRTAEALDLAKSKSDRGTFVAKRRAHLTVQAAVAGMSVMTSDAASWRLAAPALAANAAVGTPRPTLHALYEALANFAIGVARSGSPDRALAMLESSVRKGLRLKIEMVWSVLAVARAADAIDQGAGAQWVRQAVERVQTSSNSRRNQFLIPVAAALGRYDAAAAEALLRSVCDDIARDGAFRQVRGLIELAEAAHAIGARDLSHQWVARAELIAQAISPLMQSLDALGEVAVAYARTDRFDDAARLAARRMDDPRRRARAEAAMRAGNTDEALQFADAITQPLLRLHAARSIAVVAIERGQWDVASFFLGWAAQREDHHAEGLVLRVLTAAAHHETGEVLLDACAVAGRWPGSTVVALGCLARLYPAAVSSIETLLHEAGVFTLARPSRARTSPGQTLAQTPQSLVDHC